MRFRVALIALAQPDLSAGAIVAEDQSIPSILEIHTHGSIGTLLQTRIEI